VASGIQSSSISRIARERDHVGITLAGEDGAPVERERCPT
jgi:hypothetical protein